jgi:hypothetical protein
VHSVYIGLNYPSPNKPHDDDKLNLLVVTADVAVVTTAANTQFCRGPRDNRGLLLFLQAGLVLVRDTEAQELLNVSQTQLLVD